MKGSYNKRLHNWLKKEREIITRDINQAWIYMTAYERFEQLTALLLTFIISVIIIFSIFHLIVNIVRLFIMDINPLSHAVFQKVFGNILTVLIAMEFNHSIIRVISHREGIIQVKTVLLISILAITRKLIIIDLPSVEPILLIAMGITIIALGSVYWLMRERDDRLLTALTNKRKQRLTSKGTPA